MNAIPTGVPLPKKVGLTIDRVRAGKFPINLIFDAESRNNTAPSSLIDKWHEIQRVQV
jgi:hypothetical protein